MNVYVSGRRIQTGALTSVGKGGEADIFDLGNGTVLKLFKEPDHPDYDNNPHEQRGARERLALHQKKLRKFPKDLPKRVIVPQELATDDSGKYIHGYVMPFIKGADRLDQFGKREFRELGVSSSRVIRVCRDLHTTIDGVHAANGGNVVCGDLNDLNGLVKGDEVFLIDSDSLQFDSFLCTVFTQRFVDPLLCDPKESSPMLVKPHNKMSDWYAFNIILMQSLLYVDPYGGIYKPKDHTKRIPHTARPSQRITVFHPEVQYPKPAIHYHVLPDELLQHFHRTFVKDRREVFPLQLIERIEWKTCPVCHLEHARHACPGCTPGAQGIVKETLEIRGKVTATRLFFKKGTVLYAAYQSGSLRFVYHDGTSVRREDDRVVMQAPLSKEIRYRTLNDITIVSTVQGIALVHKDKQPERPLVDLYGTIPPVDVNNDHLYWIQNSQIVRNGLHGPEQIGAILAQQTRFWVGPKFGFGFYWAGKVRVNFVFDAERQGINDSVKLPPINGQLIDTACFFSDTHCWFFWTTQEAGKRINYCAVINQQGAVEAIGSADDGADSWLGTIHAKCAVGKILLAATDDGLVQVKVDQGQLVIVQTFPDTEPFVTTGCSLISGKDGIYVVTGQTITRLSIAR